MSLHPATVSSTERLIPVAILVFCAALSGGIWLATLERSEHERDEAIENEKRQNANLALAVEDHAIRTFQATDTLLRRAISRYGRDRRSQVLDDIINTSVGEQKLITYLGIADESGRSLTDSAALDASDREYFLHHRDHAGDTLFIGKPVVGRSSRKWSMHVTRRIDKPDGSFGGVAIAGIDPAYFADSIAWPTWAEVACRPDRLRRHRARAQSGRPDHPRRGPEPQSAAAETGGRTGATSSRQLHRAKQGGWYGAHLQLSHRQGSPLMRWSAPPG
jgi:hypothetical protein